MKYIPLFCLLLLFSSASKAQFDISGAGKVYLLKGGNQEFDFGFSYFRQEGSYRFIVGRHSLTVNSVPKKYSLAMMLQNDNQVWVPDFINEPINGFELELDGYKLKLYRDPDNGEDKGKGKGKGEFVFTLNNEAFYFDRGPGQVNFLFTEDGIKDVRVEGMFKPRK